MKLDKREELAAFFASIRNWDIASNGEAIEHFHELREEMITLLEMTEDEMHNAWMKKHNSLPHISE